MKLIYNLYILGVLCFLASCSDDTLLKDDSSQNKGKEVQFGVAIDPGKSTRTYYGEKIGNAYPLFWASDDRIVVSTPMGEEGNNQNKVYDIQVAQKPGYQTETYAKAIVPSATTPVGVQWGEETNEKGSFYAIYPYRAETRRRPVDLDESQIFHNTLDLNDDGSATATVLIDPDQRIWRQPYDEDEIKHNTTDSPEPTLLNMYGSNHSNVMWAQTDNVEYGSEVDLLFKPLSTCLMFTFTNPSGSASDVDAMIEDIKIVADNAKISGPMQITFPKTGAPSNGIQGANTTQTPTLTPLSSYTDKNGNVWEETNQIEIWPWIRSNQYQSGIHPILRPGDTMKICAFLRPTANGTPYTVKPYDKTKGTGWYVEVMINNKTYRASLVHNETQIQSGQIHEITMPPFDNLSAWNYDAASWMNDIDDNVYLSQITFPGSWYSYSKNTGKAAEAYQNYTIAEQLEKGVRAFDLSTKTSWTGFDNNPFNKNNYKTFDGIKISGTGSNTTATYNSGGSVNGQVYYNGTPVGNAVQTIVDYIRTKAPTEVGIIVLSYEAGGDGGLRPIDYQAWMYGLQQMYDALPTATKAAIYSDEITSETTLGELRGRTILKINLGEEVCSNWGMNSTYPYPKTVTVDGKETKEYIPALLSFSPTRWVTNNMYIFDPTAMDSEGNPLPPTPMKTDETYTFTSLTSALKWEEWDIAYNNTIINGVPKDRPDIWAWNFSCTNRTRGYNQGTGVDDDDPKYIPDLTIRQAALDTLLNEAKRVYTAGFHNEMFLFGCGGTEVESWDASTNATNPQNFATHMNEDWLNPKVKSLFTNNTPCPLGIVFFNQVANADYDGQEILTNLIKMNDAFYLQRKPTTTTKAKVKSASPNHSSGVTVNSSSWTAF